MKSCPVHPLNDANLTCDYCNLPMCETCNVSSGEKPYCRNCESKIEGETESLSFSEKQSLKDEMENFNVTKGSHKNFLIYYVVFILAITLTAYRLIDYSKDAQDISIELSDFEEVSEECILILFEIADTLNAGNSLSGNEFCPGSLSPLLVRTTESEIIVTVTDPETFGFSQMYVSNREPLPILID